MNASDLIAELAQRTGLSQLTLSPDGTACLVVEDSLSINLEHDSATRRLHLYTVLGPLPTTDREACYGRLLEANLFGLQTGGGSIGLHRPGSQIVLSRTLDLDILDYTAFEAALEQMVQSAGPLKGLLDAGAQAQASAPDPRMSHLLRG